MGFLFRKLAFMPKRISIIIPTCNEADCIGKLIAFLQKHGGEYVAEIITGRNNNRNSFRHKGQFTK